MLYYMLHHRTGLSPQYSPVLSPVLTRDKVCDAGAKSLNTLECSREKTDSVVTTTSLLPSLINYRGIHGKSRLWSQSKTSHSSE